MLAWLCTDCAFRLFGGPFEEKPLGYIEKTCSECGQTKNQDMHLVTDPRTPSDLSDWPISFDAEE